MTWIKDLLYGAMKCPGGDAEGEKFEETLKEHGCKPIGGSGGVQPDWNQNDTTAVDYVKNRTHWVETELVEEVPETEITTEIKAGFASANLDASVSPSATEEGEIRTIVFDGKEYECAMFIAEAPAFGNGALIPNDSQFPDTGEPFMYMYMPDGGGMVLTRDTTPTTHTIACYKKEETVHTIDPKFLPAGSGGGFIVNATVTMNEGSTTEGTCTFDKTYAETLAAFQAGQSVVCVVADSTDGGLFHLPAIASYSEAGLIVFSINAGSMIIGVQMGADGGMYTRR